MKAFPWSIDNGETIKGEKGMDLRDYFAAKAMQAILQSGQSGPKTCDSLHYDDHKENNMNKASCLAEGAYEMADAMMIVRAR